MINTEVKYVVKGKINQGRMVAEIPAGQNIFDVSGMVLNAVSVTRHARAVVQLTNGTYQTPALATIKRGADDVALLEQTRVVDQAIGQIAVIKTEFTEGLKAQQIAEVAVTKARKALEIAVDQYNKTAGNVNAIKDKLACFMGIDQKGDTVVCRADTDSSDGRRGPKLNPPSYLHKFYGTRFSFQDIFKSNRGVDKAQVYSTVWRYVKAGHIVKTGLDRAPEFRFSDEFLKRFAA